ncbi:Serine-threonine/tyrosine-protein kinase, catalytic domain [Sesbania bispinosa]|nr:Serine-threonine/tyrosine-protein kinase, catalytic domain [Sesbania bispinosa]
MYLLGSVVHIRIGLTGSIPENTLGKQDALRVLSLHSNGLGGSLPSNTLSIPLLQFAHLQHNNLLGLIPSSVSPRLIALDLSFNSFSASILPTFQNIRRLIWLYVQNNSISGIIPDFNLPSLKHLNLSYNNLNGSIPNSIKTFPYSSLLGNSLLCEPPLNHCSTNSPCSSPSSSHQPLSPTTTQNQKAAATHKKSFGLAVILALIFGSIAFFSLLFLVISVCCMKRKNSKSNGVLKGKASCARNTEVSKSYGSGVQTPEKNKLFFFEGSSYSFDLEDLLKASTEVLGKGSYGTTYKAVLEREQQWGAGRTPLDWDSRVKLALGAAKGIAFIHSGGGPKFAHGNIKSTNVLITQELDSYISDVGLPPLMNAPSTMSRANGYRAPEVTDSRKITQKSDVYNFGVVLLEILTGKTPLIYPSYEDVVDLPRWVRCVVREEWTAEVFDEELLRGQYVEEEMVQMLQIALTCVAKAPDMRPKMDEAVRMIEEIKQPELKNMPSFESDSNVLTP